MLSDLIGETVATYHGRRGVVRALVVLPPVLSSSPHEVCAVVQGEDGRLETIPTSHLRVVPHAL